MLKVLSADDIASLGTPGKESSESSAPALTDEEGKVLAAFRASGATTSEDFLSRQSNGTPASGSSAPASTSSTSSSEGSSKKSK